MTLLQLFFMFFYIGLITIGGGLVGITVMEQIIVEKYNLLTPELFYNMVAISECTPGPVGINMATYIGTELYGVGGGVITTLGQVLPSLIVIMIIAKFLAKFHESKIVGDAFKWLKPATTGLILVAAMNIFLLTLVNVPASISDFKAFETWNRFFNYESLIFYATALLILKHTKLHPVCVVALGAVFGVVFL